MTGCTAVPGDHEYTFAVYQVDRIPKPGSLMMLEDKFTESWHAGMSQPGLGLGKHWYKRYGGREWRGLQHKWCYHGNRRTLNDGPHFKQDNIVFFDGHGITASPQEIYDEEYWLLAK